ncbi:MAG: LysM peptidoglycan-binding domain-containing protein [Thioploca sp.]|nr:LysM peptidoglycan-binding domain-containing protein [Thioploca sp.]
MKIIIYQTSTKAPFSDLSERIGGNFKKVFFSNKRVFKDEKSMIKATFPTNIDESKGYVFFIPENWKDEFHQLLTEKFPQAKWQKEQPLQKPPKEEIGSGWSEELAEFYEKITVLEKKSIKFSKDNSVENETIISPVPISEDKLDKYEYQNFIFIFIVLALFTTFSWAWLSSGDTSKYELAKNHVQQGHCVKAQESVKEIEHLSQKIKIACQELIPEKTEPLVTKHTVIEKETLDSIAKKYNVSLQDIFNNQTQKKGKNYVYNSKTGIDDEWNNMDELKVGWELIIPSTQPNQ